MKMLREWWPELLIAAVALFFSVRELGTFPGAWADDSLNMIIAKQMAAHRGFSIPILDAVWVFPSYQASPAFFMIVTPFIRWLGFSVAVARIPQVFFLIGTTGVFYAFTHALFGRSSARAATGLLVTLSAFVNTGKPLMGEIPGFFFVLLALVALHAGLTKEWKADCAGIVAGCCLGIAVLMKLPYVLALAAAGGAWLLCLATKRRADARLLLLALAAGGLIVLSWKLQEIWFNPQDFLKTYGNYVQWKMLRVEGEHVTLALLLRFQYLFFGGLLVLAALGWHTHRRAIPPALSAVWWCAILLFIAYFLGREGWYRHLLAAHLLLLPFVPAGLARITGWRAGTTLLICLMAAQGWWQLTYKGSPRGERGAVAAAYIQKNYAGKDIIVQQAEVFVRLPLDPHWKFLPNPTFLKRTQLTLAEMTPAQKCLPLLRAFSTEERAGLEGRLTEIEGAIALLAPDDECP